MGTTTSEVATALEVRPLSAVIGAELRGVDLKGEVTDEVIAEIRAALLRYRVVFLPDQHLSAPEHLAFASRFGEPTKAHPVLPGVDGHPEVFEIDYSKGRRRNDGEGRAGPERRRRQGLGWHTDVTFVEAPPLGSILNAVTIPEAGGDTCWSSQVAAFAGLSPTLQAFLETLTAVHDGSRNFGAPDLQPVEHPVVHTHPETGEKALFVNPGFTQHIVGLHPEESDALLRFLYEHATRPEYTVRYHWTAGDLGFWDNRSTMHSVVGDYGDRHRVIQRVTLHGAPPTL